MKRLFSIAFLFIFLFNVGGYYMVFWGLRYQSNKEILSHLATNEYDKSETILLKIPMALPYPVESGFKNMRVDFEHRGEFYKLVEQKLEGDTLYIVCFKDQKEKQLVKKMIDYANLANDLPSQSKQAQNLLSKLLKEYVPFHEIEIIQCSGWAMSLPNVQRSLNLVDFEQSVQSPPPKSLS